MREKKSNCFFSKHGVYSCSSCCWYNRTKHSHSIQFHRAAIIFNKVELRVNWWLTAQFRSKWTARNVYLSTEHDWDMVFALGRDNVRELVAFCRVSMCQPYFRRTFDVDVYRRRSCSIQVGDRELRRMAWHTFTILGLHRTSYIRSATINQSINRV